MRWSWRVARIRGIDVKVHATFWILLAWVTSSSYLEHHRWDQALLGLGFVVLLFSIVVMHEFGHALVARRFHVRTLDITLLPLGGVSHMERIPEAPVQEMLIALAGPAVNVALAAVLAAALLVAGDIALPDGGGPLGGGLLERLVWVNVSLAAFNLVPAFPMDGGRVLRAILSLRCGFLRATRIAARVGQATALLLGFLGLLFNPILAFIALFVWMGAEHEAQAAQVRAAIADVPVRDVMVSEFRTLSSDDPLSRAVDHVLAGFQQDFPVVDGDRLVGVLTRSDLLHALARQGAEGRVTEVMQRRFETSEPGESMARALDRLSDKSCSTMPVLHDGRIVGLLTMDNLGEFVAVRSALSRSRSHAAPGPGPAAESSRRDACSA